MRTLFLVLLLGLVPLLGMTDPVSAADSLVFRVGKVVTMDQEDRVINNAVVVVEDGKIAVIGRARDIEIPAGVTVVERPELWLVPGLVECHNHTGGGSSDLHDYIYLTNPGLRTLESIIPDNPEMERARAGGVTTILTIPGSGNNFSSSYHISL